MYSVFRNKLKMPENLVFMEHARNISAAFVFKAQSYTFYNIFTAML